MTRPAAAVAGALVLALAAPIEAQSPAQRELLARTAAYVADFITRFVNVVAEERYVQETTSPRRERVLVSDYLLVQLPGATEWEAFRDVLEVNGKPVKTPQSEERLLRLLSEPADDLVTRAYDIMAIGARYNLVDIGTLNDPLRVVAFMQARYQDRFRFTFAGIEKDLGPDVRTVQFQEYQRPTLIRAGGMGDLFSRGLVWVSESTGRIVRTELRIGSIRIETRFAHDEALGVTVPVEMRDVYPDRTGEMFGVAKYGRFRRFQVQTSEVTR